MEKLEQQTQIINLGKQLVDELDVESKRDTFSKWMAHYISEKIILADSSQGDTKKEAEKECFETILKLWERRWFLPSGRRPFEKFEPILKTLERLNPEEKEPFFYHSLNHELSELEKGNPDLKEIMDSTNVALQIDKVARIWIDFVFKMAALKATDEKTKSLLENSINLQNDYDVKIITRIFDNGSEIDLEGNKEDVEKKFKLEKLKTRIQELEKFSKLNDFLLANYNKDLESLQ